MFRMNFFIKKSFNNLTNITIPTFQKPLAQHPAPETEVKHVTKLGEHPDNIQQSGTFKRLMMHVLGETEY